jgi:hypothetical protein
VRNLSKTLWPQQEQKAQEIGQPINIAVVDAGRHGPPYTLKEEVTPTQTNNDEHRPQNS